MNDQDRKEKRQQRKAVRLVEDARKAEERAGTGPVIHLVIGPKGGIGKSTLARLLIDKHRLTGGGVRIVQIDRTALLPRLYADLVSVVHLPGAEEMRSDPLAAMTAMEPLSAAIDASLADGVPVVVDVGGGPSAAATVEYIGKARLDAYLRNTGVRVVVWLVFVADPYDAAVTVHLSDLWALIQQAKVPHLATTRIGELAEYPLRLMAALIDAMPPGDLVMPFVLRRAVACAIGVAAARSVFRRVRDASPKCIAAPLWGPDPRLRRPR